MSDGSRSPEPSSCCFFPTATHFSSDYHGDRTNCNNFADAAPIAVTSPSSTLPNNNIHRAAATPVAIQHTKKQQPQQSDDPNLKRLISTNFDLIPDMQNLSLQQRNEVSKDVSGHVEDGLEKETAELIQTSLEDLQWELGRVRDRKEYEHAAFLCPRYVKSRDFQLMFLRADKFDAKKAAKRMAAFFKLKESLFGYDALARPLRMSDLNEEDRQAMRRGSIQVRPDCREIGGRVIVSDVANVRKFDNVENQLRSVIYLLMHHLERDVSSQRRGLVAVGYWLQLDVSVLLREAKLNLIAPTIMNAIPVRATTTHLCFNSSKVSGLLRALMSSVPEDVRLRQIVHFGSHLECQYKLFQVYGMPEDRFPLDSDGKLKLQQFWDILNAMEQEEIEAAKAEESAASRYISYPSELDVLMGRGQPTSAHPGNQRHREVVQKWQTRYDQADHHTKTMLAIAVNQEVREFGGRFLKRAKPEELGWEEITIAAAQAKTSQTFRSNRRR